MIIIIVLALTRPECKYRLCGIMIAPIIPTAWRRADSWQFEHQGVTKPLAISLMSGWTIAN